MTIWYDFTTTIRNRGRNGIASVEWNLGQALLAAEPGVRLFEMRGRQGLVELDRGRLDLAVYASPDAGAPVAWTVVPTWRDRVRGALRVRLGRRADPIIRGLSAAYQIPATVRALPGRIGAEAVPRTRFSPLSELVRAGDTVVSMGADWDGELAAHLLGLKRSTGCSVVTMVYDLVPLTHTHLAFHNEPDLFVRYYRALLETSDLITCISEQSRRDLIAFAAEQRALPPRSEVLTLGESEPTLIEPVGTRHDDVFLCVGTIERRKNLELIYDALRILESEGGPLPRVVVVGATGWGTGDLLHELRQQSTAASRAMLLLGSVDDETLDRLYRTSTALLFPSHFEGWGLPVREAAIRGCPVAAGDSPAIRDAAAGYAGATLLPADDAGPWADFMRQPVTGAERSATRPWSAVAADLLALLTSGHDNLTCSVTSS